jgi:hypothetical protein
MTLDSILFHAGSLFFAGLIAVIAGVSLAAFGRDIFPSTAQPDPARDSPPVGPTHSTSHY